MPDDIDRALAAGWHLSEDVIAANRKSQEFDSDFDFLLAKANERPERKRRKSTATNPMGEDALQIKIIEWADSQISIYPELAWLHHSANGGGRSKREGALFKRMGVRKGVADLFLPVPRVGWHGLYGECKVGRNDLTPEQDAFLEFVRKQGYYTCVWWDEWELAAHDIKRYLDGQIKRPQ